MCTTNMKILHKVSLTHNGTKSHTGNMILKFFGDMPLFNGSAIISFGHNPF